MPGTEQQYTRARSAPCGKACTRAARILASHQREAHPALGEGLVQEPTTELPVGYHVCSSCLDIYSNLTGHAATRLKRHPRSTPSKQDGSQGSTQMGGKSIEERASQGTQGQRKEASRGHDGGSRQRIATGPAYALYPQGLMPERLPLAWGVTEISPALDFTIGEQLTKCASATVEEVHPQHRGQLGLALKHGIRLLLRAYDEFALHRAIGPDPLPLTLERAAKVLHLRSGLLMSADGRINIQERFNAFLAGDVEVLSS